MLNFEFGAVQKGIEGWDVGKGISDLLVDELLKRDTYVLIERQRLDAVVNEQAIAGQGVSTGTGGTQATQVVGKLAGAHALVTGSVTQFGTEQKNSRFGGGLIKFVPVVGGVAEFGKQKGKAKVAVTARIIDATTGQVLGSASGEGTSKREGTLLGGLGVGGGTIAGGGMSMTSSDFRQTILGEATVLAVSNLADELIKANNKIPVRKIEIRGKVAFVDGQKLVLNVGAPQGVQVGDVFVVSNIKSTIKDPDSGKVIKEEIEDLGQARVEQVEESSSTAVVVSGTGFQVGNLVTKK